MKCIKKLLVNILVVVANVGEEEGGMAGGGVEAGEY